VRGEETRERDGKKERKRDILAKRRSGEGEKRARHRDPKSYLLVLCQVEWAFLTQTTLLLK